MQRNWNMEIDKDKRTPSLSLGVGFITFVLSMTIANALWIILALSIFKLGSAEALKFPIVVGIIGGIAFKVGVQLREIYIGAIILSIADVVLASVSVLY